MRVKVEKNDVGEVVVSYFKAKDVDQFRFELLGSIIHSYGDDVYIMIDTNQRKKALDFREINDYLESERIRHLSAEIPANETKLFGFSFNFMGAKKKDPERLFALSLSPEAFTKSLFDALFYNYDLAIGFGPKFTFEEFSEKYTVGVHELMFSDTYFKDTIYDSGVFETMRSSIDIYDQVKMIGKEY